MPIYEYHCDSCQNDFEKLVLGGREPEGCPTCESDQVNRLVSAFSFKSAGSVSTPSSASTSSSSCGG
jgi:putative FmdB family regulatory protein